MGEQPGKGETLIPANKLRVLHAELTTSNYPLCLFRRSFVPRSVSSSFCLQLLDLRRNRRPCGKIIHNERWAFATDRQRRDRHGRTGMRSD